MRMLHNQSAVSREHEGASKFLNLRDQTRRNALIFANTLLRKFGDIAFKIKEHAYGIKASDFEEWEESLEEITEEVASAKHAFHLLTDMNFQLVSELKYNEDSAKFLVSKGIINQEAVNLTKKLPHSSHRELSERR